MKHYVIGFIYGHKIYKTIAVFNDAGTKWDVKNFLEGPLRIIMSYSDYVINLSTGSVFKNKFNQDVPISLFDKAEFIEKLEK